MTRGGRPAYEFRGSSPMDHVGRRPVMELLSAARTGNAGFDVVPEEYQHCRDVAVEFAAEVLVARGVDVALVDDCRRAMSERIEN